jgi:hypothetical protein
MMHPMRVEWTVPDEAKRAAARDALDRDRRNQTNGLAFSLISARGIAEQHEIVSRRYPDLEAVVVHFGTLLSIRYVPSHLGYEERAGSLPQVRSFAVPARWVALVATADGTREMDPTKLRVMWPMSAGDPIGGVIDLDQRAREEAARREGR